MTSYQIDCGYPSASQFLSSSASHLPSVQSPLAATTLSSNAVVSISPSPTPGADVSAASSNSDSSAGTLTPDGASQTSALGSATNSTAASTTLDIHSHLYPLTGPLISAVNATTHLQSSASLTAFPSVPSTGSSSSVTPACCDNGRPMVTDPLTGQSICSCQYEASVSPTSRLAALSSSYSRLPSSASAVAGVGMSVFGSTYPSNDQNPYPSIAVETATPFYTSLNTPYALKDSASSSAAAAAAWTSTALQPSSYYTYDPTFGACGYGASYDLAARRKNATRESTATLKAWLHEHMKNPYPTKGEKIMLAIITKMTLTQVSTWFANARRRLKKENKMTWEPKNRTEDEDACLSDDEKEHEQPAHQDDKRTTTTTTTAAIAATPTAMGATLQQTTPLMPSVKRLDYDSQHNNLNATGGSGVIGVNGAASLSLSLNHNSTNNSVSSGGSGIAGSQGVGVATDLIGSHHHALAGGLNTQVKDPYHLTSLPQNLQQYSTNFYYPNTAAAAAAAVSQQYSHHSHASALQQHSHLSPPLTHQTSSAVANVAASASVAAAALASAISPSSLRSQISSYDNSSILLPSHHSAAHHLSASHHSHHPTHSLLSSSYSMDRR